MSRPVDWSPLRGRDPVPGDPVAVGQQVTHLRDVALELQDQVARLTEIARPGALRGQYAGRLREAAEGIVDDLGKVQRRYARVASALSPWQGQLRAHQSRADRIRTRARLLDAERDRLQAAVRSYRPTSLPPDASPSAVAAVDAAGQAHARTLRRLHEVEVELQRLDGDLRDVERDRDLDARSVARAVEGTLDDGVEDSRWDDVRGTVSGAVERVGAAAEAVGAALAEVAAVVRENWADWLKVGLEALSWLATGLALAALFLPGINVLVIAGLAAALVVGHGVLLATGNGTWADVGIAVFGLLTFGVGRLVAKPLALAARSRAVRAAAPLAGQKAGPSALKATSARRAQIGKQLGRKLSKGRERALRQELDQMTKQSQRDVARRTVKAEADYLAKKPLVPTRKETLLAGGDAEVAAIARDIERVRRQFPDAAVTEAARGGVGAVHVVRGTFLSGTAVDATDKVLGESVILKDKPYLPAYQDGKDSTAP